MCRLAVFFRAYSRYLDSHLPKCKWQVEHPFSSFSSKMFAAAIVPLALAATALANVFVRVSSSSSLDIADDVGTCK